MIWRPCGQYYIESPPYTICKRVDDKALHYELWRGDERLAARRGVRNADAARKMAVDELKAVADAQD